MGVLRQLKRRIRRRSVSRVPPPVVVRPVPEDYVLKDQGLQSIEAVDWAPAWRSGTSATDEPPMKAVHPDVWVGPVLSPEWCERLLVEAETYRQWTQKYGSVWSIPNSMHHRGILLSELGLEGLFELWMRSQLQPWAERNLGSHLAGPLTEYHAYLVEYSPESQSDLGFHVDDSQVTLNLCLGREFEGSELYFEGPRCALHVDSPSRSGEPFEWRHRPGIAVLHAGKNRHGVRPIWKGRRWSLIVWFRDGTGRARWDADWEAERCPDWCGVDGKHEPVADA